ncbi:MAG: hypothetical protein WAX80_02925 [Minisyncoccia bacterium]
MRWEDVLKRDDIVGGDIETQEDGSIYRGPLSGIKMENGLVHFESPWIAQMEGGMGGDGKWKNWPVYPCFVDAKRSPPQDIGNGRIQFNMPFLGFGVIFPKGGSKLDPDKVEGLQLAGIPT